MIDRHPLHEVWSGDAAMLGAWCTLPGRESAVLVGRSGFDWCGLDMQHGLIGYEGMVEMIPPLAASGTAVLVRVPSGEASSIGRALDAGAHGVIVPGLRTADDADLAAKACRYPPAGSRSWGPIESRVGGRPCTPASSDRDVICAVMIQSAPAAAAIDEIVGVWGVDAVLVDPDDLAVSLGRWSPERGVEPKVVEVVREVGAACGAAGIVCGVICRAEEVSLWLEAGMRLLAIQSDVDALRDGLRGALERARRLADSTHPAPLVLVEGAATSSRW